MAIKIICQQNYANNIWIALKFLLKWQAHSGVKVRPILVKSHNTAKGLIEISLAGAVTFVSDLYAGRSSDKQITKDCGILDLVEEGDSIMADKGFEIADDLPKGVTLNISPFLRGNNHLSIEDETETLRISSVRIHVERVISRIKTFRI